MSNSAQVIASLGIQPPEDDCFCAAGDQHRAARARIFFRTSVGCDVFLAQQFEIQVCNHVTDDVAGRSFCAGVRMPVTWR